MGRNPALPREEILELASEHLAEVGFSTATMRSVATALGISTTPLVNYFGTKEELVAAVVGWREDTDRETVLASGGDLDSIERYWVDSVSPRRIKGLRLSFEVATHQSRTPDDTGSSSDAWYLAWIEESTRCLTRLGLSRALADREARSLTAILVGLQFEVLITGEIEPAHAVLRRHLKELDERIAAYSR